MKFGKRLASEALRRHTDHYFDYKAIKKAIKDDIDSTDANGTHFQAVLVGELQKVSQYYSSKAELLERTLASLRKDHSQELEELRSDVQELIKFVALNYLAVVKAIKKRNRHLKESFGAEASTSLHALDLLIGEVFFTSPRLASLATEAEVLSQELAARRKAQTQQGQHAEVASQLLEEYQCPVCLDTLHNPVVLTCAHRFCWGCLVAHCTAHRDITLPIGKKDTSVAAPATSYRVLEQIACCNDPDIPEFYPCPVCRKPQILDIDTLQVDTYLEQFINNLKAISSVSVSSGIPKAVAASAQAGHTAQCCGSSTVLSPVQPQQQQQQQEHLKLQLTAGHASSVQVPRSSLEPWGVIPPQAAVHRGKMTVLLDLDGTLVSSFTPKRAPRLPAYIKTHVVGLGSKLNPQGVFVVERPGLNDFLTTLAAFAEVIIYTAGLEDYAKPIIDAIDPTNSLFAGRIYREGTLRTEYYQCVKDMARVNRDLTRTVLVDDTPLAFLHQPCNGIPVLGFRGDPDDRLLMEAVLPLLQVLATEPDIKPVLHRRFDMRNWFKRHGFPVDAIEKAALKAAFEERERHMAQATARCCAGAVPQAPSGLLPPHEDIAPPTSPKKQTLLLTDFDKTLLDWDAGERLVEQLAPECLALLMGTQSPANFIPITNTVMAELQRRGVSRDLLLTTLQHLGATEMPSGSVNLLRAMHRAGVDIKILSDCNSIFITHILAGAKIAGAVSEVITNAAAFERLPTSQQQQQPPSPSQQRQVCSHKLVISPHHSPTAAPHCCPLCPENLCKGSHVRALRRAGTYRHIVYAGDGLNDVCAALALGPHDVILARKGYPLADWLQDAARGKAGTRRPLASVRLWSTHDQLAQEVSRIAAGQAGPA
ncbi:hypothetical protein QJQ45_029513 [Haematococcus lacustris]|nr:hypothetical protein QJQ45_029513 [Haematococcus lacustris]